MSLAKIDSFIVVPEPVFQIADDTDDVLGDSFNFQAVRYCADSDSVFKHPGDGVDLAGQAEGHFFAVLAFEPVAPVFHDDLDSVLQVFEFTFDHCLTLAEAYFRVDCCDNGEQQENLPDGLETVAEHCCRVRFDQAGCHQHCHDHDKDQDVVEKVFYRSDKVFHFFSSLFFCLCKHTKIVYLFA